jgi:signal transduction histidine kinase
MIRWARSKLAFRQAGYAVAAIVVVASLVSLVEGFQFYIDERDRLMTTQRQQIDVVSSAATRAAFHVDDIQATTILDGLFRFENLEWARITTDLGEVLAERQRAIPSSFLDPLARFLFGDIAWHRRQLSISAVEGLENENQIRNDGTAGIGHIELRTSPELIGRNFFSGIGTIVSGLVFQFVLLGMTLVVIFHRTLTRPLLRYADAVSRLGSVEVTQPILEVPKGHEHDEFGIVVARTNQLLERITTQHQALLHREKVAALGTLLAGVSHELNNPLAILVAQGELLVETAPNADIRRRSEKILAMVNRCVVIVRRFLALARHREVEKEALDIGPIIGEVLEIMDHQLEQTGVETTVTVPPDLPSVLADPTQVTQALLNLVINAQHALAAGAERGQIAIDAEYVKEEAAVRITIADNGPGIPVESRARIFEPFYTTKSEGQGTGLGLSYAFNVAADHGGKLVLGESQLGGAAFSLTLPLAIDVDSNA